MARVAPRMGVLQLAGGQQASASSQQRPAAAAACSPEVRVPRFGGGMPPVQDRRDGLLLQMHGSAIDITDMAAPFHLLEGVWRRCEAAAHAPVQYGQVAPLLMVLCTRWCRNLQRYAELMSLMLCTT